MEGLVRDNANVLHDRKIIVHCNLLWMSSPKADLEHTGSGALQSLDAGAAVSPANSQLFGGCIAAHDALIDRKVPYFSWVGHIENCYYDQKSISRWTLEDDGQEPPNYPHAWENPLTPLHRHSNGKWSRSAARPDEPPS